MAYWSLLVWTLVLALVIVWQWFHRHPDRSSYLNSSPDYLVSPADGTVIKAQPGHIAIFLSLWNVHVQYSPVKGHVSHQRYQPGTFHPAYLLTKSQYNERLQTTIQPQKGRAPIVVYQIAGQIARSISSYVRPGQRIQQGQPLGMIHLGSRVDLYYSPQEWPQLLVKVGQTVTGAVSKLVGQKPVDQSKIR